MVAHTGLLGPESPAARLFGLKLPAVGPIPLTVIQNVSDFLSNRTVRLTITGTTNNPIVRVNVGALLSEEAVRFLLGKYVLPADTAECARSEFRVREFEVIAAELCLVNPNRCPHE